MAEKLTDPNKPAHEIIEVLEDGGAMRNDGVRLQAANKNPWYVLATIYGELGEGADFQHHDRKTLAKNRRAWNGWYCGGLSEEEREERAKRTGLKTEDLEPLSKEELEEVTTRFQARMGNDEGNYEKLPEPTADINFSEVFFSRFLCLDQFVLETNACFNSAVFTWHASFISATFGGVASFRSVAFDGMVDFYSVTFIGSAHYNEAVFNRSAIFQSSTFKTNTDFDKARFLSFVPEFHAAELYDNTVFPIPDKHTKNWPPLKGNNVMPAADQKRAYNRLRLFMNRSLQIDEEQFFHRQEMRCKAVLAKWCHKPFYWLYARLSDYGNSVLGPAWWLFVVWLSGWIAKMEAVQGELCPDWHSVPSAMGWSFANLFSFFGFHKRYFGEEELNAVLQVTGGVQTVAGFILLFFLGLGLRNRFRLR